MTGADQRTRGSRAFLTLLVAVGAGLAGVPLRPTPAAAAGVVGTGTRESCTDAALDAALAGGGVVTFNCGGSATIDISTGTGTKTIAADTTVDGGGVITISGGDRVPVFVVNSGVGFAVSNLTIANGTGSDPAGGISSVGGRLQVANSTFAGNGGQFGGAISNVRGTLTVSSSTFTGNRTGGVAGGAGVYTDRGESLITNCTFSDNDARLSDGGGGGVLNFDGTVTIVNSTFASNFAGAISSYGDGASIVVRNTIITDSPPFFHNCSPNLGIIDGGHNLEDGTSCGFSAGNDSLSDTDPQLDPAGLKDNGGSTQTVALCTAVDVPAGCTAASPAIDAGDQAVCSMAPVNDLDQRGFVRPGTGHTNCSIGAYEADAIPPRCVGDCDGNGKVAINELVLGVNIVLDLKPLNACPAFAHSEGMTDIAQLVKGVNNALNDCPPGGTECKAVDGTERVDVGGYQLRINCVGSGEPTVLFDSGTGAGLEAWSTVQPAVGGFTRTCAYDRAGLGGSDSGPLPRTSEQIVSELHALLKNGCLPAPYVLVGHSFGGLNIHLYASTYPQDVAGLVFVDATPAEFCDRWAASGLAEVRPCIRCPITSGAIGSECLNIEASQTQVQAAGPLPDVPMVVLVAGAFQAHSGPPLTDVQSQQREDMWLELQTDLAHSVPDGTLSVLPECGHIIQLCRPDLITEAIQDMLGSLRMEYSDGQAVDQAPSGEV